MNKQITSHQLFTFSALSTLGGSILVVSSAITGIAKQDAWISVLVTMVFGLFMMWVYTFLATRFNGLTLIGLTQKIFGKWIGKLIAIGYFLYIFITAYDVPWYIGGFHSNIMHETPVAVIVVLFYAALVIAVYYGIEAIARSTELFFVLFTVVIILSVLLVLPEVNIQYIQPVFENGINPILKGAVVLSAYISIQNFTILMIFPAYIKDKKLGKRAFVKGFLWANIVVFFTVLVSILVLGSAVIAKSAFPTVTLTKEINIGMVLTRFEYVISSIWTISEFVIAILYFLGSILALSELLGLKEHTKIAAPMGLLCMMFSWTVNSTAIEKESWIPVGLLPNTLVLGLIMPLLMLAVYGIRKLIRKDFGSQGG